ncbi:hypothetical protein GCM10010260_19640 [Streptomyces filipinensis]|uniref:Uncharacterized protein n=1 Tax=Streptomyces filipinensis TaxID=66887 RepID=A0A918IAC6_9ACTN|nr:hypothetical protein GCM10010260_19640 [Streptomyces filipinensis]
MKSGISRSAADAGLLRHAEAVGLLAVSAGIGTSVLVGRRDADSATAVLACHLDRIFGAADPP